MNTIVAKESAISASYNKTRVRVRAMARFRVRVGQPSNGAIDINAIAIDAIVIDMNVVLQIVYE